ncbi:MAG: hypothetical protein HY521_07700 [Proteobacteria bacterium]|nr:hypothetical protein [Pseudomonadota bacterium]
MEWLTENWTWLLLGLGMVGMHFLGHGRHGSHGGGHGCCGGGGHGDHAEPPKPSPAEAPGRPSRQSNPLRVPTVDGVPTGPEASRPDAVVRKRTGSCH